MTAILGLDVETAFPCVSLSEWSFCECCIPMLANISCVLFCNVHNENIQDLFLLAHCVYVFYIYIYIYTHTHTHTYTHIHIYMLFILSVFEEYQNNFNFCVCE